MADEEESKTRMKGVEGGNLEFVNMNVWSAEERERNSKVVRSTAMKSFRRRQKSQREEGESSGKGKKKQEQQRDREDSEPFVPVKTETSLLVSRSPALVPMAEPAQVTHSDISWFVGSPSSSSSDSSNGEAGLDEGKPIQTSVQPEGGSREQKLRHFSTKTSPKTLLGAGRVDPFQAYPIALTVIWRGLRPREEDNNMSTFAGAWLGKMKENPIVMHAMLFGAQVHLDVLRSPQLSLDNPVRLYHKVQTMRLLKEELKNPEKLPLDDVILAILTLSANEVETVANNMAEKESSPFNSPLASLQWLDVYGSITHLAAHTTAMRSLVDRRGGLDEVGLEGLAEVLSYSDILGSTQNLQKPYWPLPKRTLTVQDIHTPEILKVPLAKIGQGFQELIPCAMTDEFLTTIRAIGNLTVIINCHCRGMKPIGNLTQFIDKRNAVQHQLLSLPSGEELTQGKVSSASIYECVRLATILYSAAVTFPLPPLTGIFHNLASILRNVLEESKTDSHWRSSSKALLWILALGGIAASGTRERSWYVQNLSTVLSAMKLSTWNQVSIELESFLWLESACGSSGRELWNEVKGFEARGS